MILAVVKANEGESSVILKHKEYLEKMEKIRIQKLISRTDE
jgi:hypothetical protein